MKALSTLVLALPLALAAVPAFASAPHAAPARIAMTCGQSQLFNSRDSFVRVAISDPKVADVRVISGQQLLVNGLKPGQVNLLVWTKKYGVKSYQVTVGLDTDAVERQVRAVTGNQALRVAYNGRSFLLTGEVGSVGQRMLAEKVAASYGQPVLNLTALPVHNEQIAIDVEVVELSKTAVMNLGLTYGGGQPTANANGIMTYDFKPWQMMLGQTNGAADWSHFGNLQFLAVQLNAMTQKGEARVLARPHLVTTDGGTAKFLAGGEIPIPVSQALGTTTIEWKPFGVRLDIQPTLNNDGRIDMKIAPEVSSLDYSNGLKEATFTIPSIKTRRIETEVMVGAQETLMLGGLMNADQTRDYNLIPGLGDIPVLGELFKSRSFQDNQSELAVFVTPSLVEPGTATLPGHLPEVRQQLNKALEH